MVRLLALPLQNQLGNPTAIWLQTVMQFSKTTSL
jgi:hypothetical protein